MYLPLEDSGSGALFVTIPPIGFHLLLIDGTLKRRRVRGSRLDHTGFKERLQILGVDPIVVPHADRPQTATVDLVLGRLERFAEDIGDVLKR
jgi:hypothetical protein